MKTFLKLPKKPQNLSSGSSHCMRLFAWNLCLIGLMGVVASFWVIRFTDWFPVVGGLLALGGVFSWLAFVSKILEKARVNAIKRWVDETILSRRRTTFGVVALLVSGSAVAGLYGTIQIQSLSGGAASAVFVERMGNVPHAKPGAGLPNHILTSENPLRLLVFTGWPPFIGDSSNYRVKQQGYPDIVVRIRPYRRVELISPRDLRRNVVLLLPTLPVRAALAAEGGRLEVELDGKDKYEVEDYKGTAIWIGTDADTDISAEAWREMKGIDPSERLLNIWLPATTLTENRFELSGVRKINVRLFKKDGAIYAERTVFPDRQRFVQVEELDEGDR